VFFEITRFDLRNNKLQVNMLLHSFVMIMIMMSPSLYYTVDHWVLFEINRFALRHKLLVNMLLDSSSTHALRHDGRTSLLFYPTCCGCQNLGSLASFAPTTK